MQLTIYRAFRAISVYLEQWNPPRRDKSAIFQCCLQIQIHRDSTFSFGTFGIRQNRHLLIHRSETMEAGTSNGNFVWGIFYSSVKFGPRFYKRQTGFSLVGIPKNIFKNIKYRQLNTENSLHFGCYRASAWAWHFLFVCLLYICLSVTVWYCLKECTFRQFLTIW